MSSRATILGHLRAAQRPFPETPALTAHLPMTPLTDPTPDALLDRFVQEAEALQASVLVADSAKTAVDSLLAHIHPDQRVLCWAFDQIPLPGLADALSEHNISVADPTDATVRVGITGANAALAATGTLVVATGNGRSRGASLLPALHIAVIERTQILPTMEAWAQLQRENGLTDVRQASNVVLISGPSRTADIAMELILGMHGPKSVHIIIV